MRENEELCRRCFDRYLVDRLGLQPISWREGEDPPEYYLVVECRKFAVEVTTLVGEIKTGSKSIADIEYVAALRKLAKRIQAVAIQRGILRGTYGILFNGPFDRLGRISSLIESQALNYIRDTQNLSEAPSCTIFKQGDRTCSIQKIKSSPDKIGYGINALPDWGKWEGDILTEACHVLQKAISQKKEKLEHITLPKILLLLDQYSFAEPHIYKQCIEGLNLLECFHSIFIVKKENEGYFLHTQDRSWSA